MRFKQFLIERSAEDQINSVRQNRDAFLAAPTPKATEAFPKIDVLSKGARTTDFDWIPSETASQAQFVKSPNVSETNPKALGMYDPSDQTVSSYGKQSASVLKGTVTHEAGHLDQDLRQQATGKKQAGSSLRQTSPNIDPIVPGSEGTRPFQYQEYAYTDIETNARAITDADAAADSYGKALSKELKNINPNDLEAVQTAKNQVRTQTLDTHMAPERHMSMANVNNVLNIDDPTITPEARGRAMDRVLEMGEKAETNTQNKIARSMQMVEKGTLSPAPVEPTVLDTLKMTGKQVSGKLTQALPGSSSPLVSGAANLGAGVVGGLVGEYVIKPEAEKIGFFKAIESGTRAALSNTPDWVAKVADPVLGAARLALDPIGTTSEFLEKQARMSLPTTKAERDRATERFERKDY